MQPPGYMERGCGVSYVDDGTVELVIKAGELHHGGKICVVMHQIIGVVTRFLWWWQDYCGGDQIIVVVTRVLWW